MNPTWSSRRSPGSATAASSGVLTIDMDPIANYAVDRNRCPERAILGIGSDPVRCSAPKRQEAVMPSTAPPGARRTLGRGRRHRGRLGRGRPRPAPHDARPAGADPGVRGVRARARRRGPHPRPRALQHRPGGRRGRLGARAHQRGLGQRLAPRPPPVPGQGAAHVEPKGLDPPEPCRRRRARRCCCARWPRSAGSTAGFSHGRGGSMHLQWKDAGAMGTNAIVGGGVPHGRRVRLGAPGRPAPTRSR